ncbi:MAG: hypothetical protein A2117_02235 [Candidatus Wildermuthbacteria bacterium GWA2_46_15]|uniref:Vitamin K epoxide reductase domain-containing protein n=1 Tax=Candidatus Wildermuthbacteria bacterium GWA2_46_15 TaxID=1802443 RepID=A0A1G2QNG9_9BACT|nr:MAG: hypothetical protein A2117_02235 [Candidatus Wildermuthbacteria bacterium GWA2_46_15]
MEPYLTLLLIFSGLGIVDTLYLAYHSITKTDVACPFFPKEWCRKVQYSQLSRTFGIPNSYLGLVMYLVIFGLTIGHINALAVPFWWLQLVIGFGFLFSLYFTFVQAFILRAFCTWCVVSAVSFTALAVAAFILR